MGRGKWEEWDKERATRRAKEEKGYREEWKKGRGRKRTRKGRNDKTAGT